MSPAESELTLAPIGVFAYNRCDRLAGMLHSLQGCHGFANSPVTVFVDGPKGARDRAAVSDVQDLVRKLNLPNVSYSFRTDNIGLRNSIFAGVSELINRSGRAIILEDDLVLSPCTLTYFNDALTHYKSAHRVWSISGYVYDAPELRRSTETLALPFAHPWGWATWARAWNRFDLDARPDRKTLNTRSFQSAFDMDGLYPFSEQLKNSIDGRVNSWFIHWYYTVFESAGVSIFPPRRLVDNFGLRDGSHGGAMNPQDSLVKRPPLMTEIPAFSEPNVINYQALDFIRTCREVRVQRLIAKAGSAKRTVKSAVGK